MHVLRVKSQSKTSLIIHSHVSWSLFTYTTYTTETTLFNPLSSKNISRLLVEVLLSIGSRKIGKGTKLCHILRLFLRTHHTFDAVTLSVCIVNSSLLFKRRDNQAPLFQLLSDRVYINPQGADLEEEGEEELDEEDLADEETLRQKDDPVRLKDLKDLSKKYEVIGTISDPEVNYTRVPLLARLTLFPKTWNFSQYISQYFSTPSKVLLLSFES